MAEKLLNALRLLERTAVVALFAAMVLLFFANITVRTVLPGWSSSMVWAEGAARLAMIWGIFLIAGITLERGRHIAMTSLIALAPERARRLAGRLIGLAGAAFFGYLLYLAITITAFVFRTGQVMPDIGISGGYLYLGPAIGLGLLTLRYVIRIFAPVDPALTAVDEV